jgi:hypothetical protein
VILYHIKNFCRPPFGKEHLRVVIYEVAIKKLYVPRLWKQPADKDDVKERFVQFWADLYSRLHF